MRRDWGFAGEPLKAEKKPEVGLTPEVLAFVDRVEGIKAVDETRGRPYRLPGLAQKVGKLEPEKFKKLDDLSRRVAYPRSVLVLLDGNGIDYLYSPNPNIRQAAELFVELQNGAGLGMLNDYSKTGEIFRQMDPESYLKGKFDLLRRARDLGASVPISDLLALDELKVRAVEDLPDASHRKFFAPHLGDERIDPDELKERIAAWERIMTAELWDFAQSDGWELKQLIVESRASWIEALEAKQGLEGLRDILKDSAAARSFRAGNAAAKLAEVSQNRIYEYGYLKEREILPMSSVDERTTEEVHDIMEACGLSEFVRDFVSSISIVRREDIQAASGLWQGVSLSISLAVERKDGYSMPGTLFHELGHAIQEKLPLWYTAQRLFDRYAVEALYSGLKASSEYAEAYALLKNREDPSFIAESFAEDFRILLEYPELLSEEKLKMMSGFFVELKFKLNLEQVQGKVRKMYGYFYGVSAKDVQRPTDCASAVKMAEHIERADQANPFL